MFSSGPSPQPTRATAIVDAAERAARWLKAFAFLEDAPVARAPRALHTTTIARDAVRRPAPRRPGTTQSDPRPRPLRSSVRRPGAPVTATHAHPCTSPKLIRTL